ncbi:MAG: hypothetical protein ACRDHL_00930, partial [Candidatus Promineifilaceae bacterium]
IALPASAGLSLILAAAATAGLANRLFGADTAAPDYLASPLLWLALLAAMLYGLVALGRLRPRRYWQTFWLAVLGLALAFIAAGRPGALTAAYGDSAYFERVIGGGQPFARWLLGAAVAGWLHLGLWLNPLLRPLLPAGWGSVATFIQLLSAAAVALGTLLLFRRTRRPLALALASLSPLWLMFASGYSEYYPLIVVPFAFALDYLFARPLRARPAAAIGLLSAGLPLLYAGFAPFSGLLLLAYGLARRERALAAVAWTSVIAAAVVSVVWPAGVYNFIENVYQQLNYGPNSSAFAAFNGQESALGIFFRPAFLLASVHVYVKSYMLFFGGGLASLALFLGAGLFWAWSQRGRPPGRLDLGRALLGLSFAGWSLAYAAFMIPKLPPRRDVDLFFFVPIVLGYLAGLFLSDALGRRPGHAAVVWLLLAALLGTTAVNLQLLLFSGIPTA